MLKWKSEPVMGLKIIGQKLIPQQIVVDQTFQKCPIAHAAGIPVYVKRLFDEPRTKSKRYAIVRMMSQPLQGLAPMDWQYGGMLQMAPHVLFARSDSIQFTTGDWAILDDFQMAMLDDGPRLVKRKNFKKFIKSNFEGYTQNLALEVLYPKGQRCKVNGLVSKTELNGKKGVFCGHYHNMRVGIQFQNGLGKYLLKPVNITKT